MEFILDDSTSEFYFLEVNTRLQVEHPVSEITHDVDLVALMLHQADYQLARKGGGIPSSDLLSLEREAPAGHAIECRLYAENPLRSFAPSPGLLQQVEWSKGKELGRYDFEIEPQHCLLLLSLSNCSLFSSSSSSISTDFYLFSSQILIRRRSSNRHLDRNWHCRFSVLRSASSQSDHSLQY